jgi:outer membrane usher protein
LNASLAASHDTRLGSGELLQFGLQRQTRSLSFGASIELASAAFSQVGQSPGTLAARQLAQTYVSYSTHGYGSFGLSYAVQLFRSQESTRLLGANYNVGLGRLGYLTLSATRLTTSRSSMLYALTLTRPLDSQTSVSGALQSDRNSSRATLDLQRNLPPGDGFGYHLRAEGGDHSGGDATLMYQNGHGTYTLEAAQINGISAARADVAGGLVWFGGDLFSSRRIDESFGVVQVPGYPDVRVYADNQEIATTNSAGNALIPRLRSYEQNPIRIEQADLPLDAEIDTLELPATPALRSGVLVAFPIRRSLGAEATIVLDDGSPMPSGALAQVEGQSQAMPIAMDGKVYLTGLAPSNRVRVSWRNQSCELLLLFTPSNEPIPQLGRYVCPGVKP